MLCGLDLGLQFAQFSPATRRRSVIQPRYALMKLTELTPSRRAVFRQRVPLRWQVGGLLFLVTFVNFLNRLTIAVLSPVLMARLHLNSSQFASLTTSFLVAYTVSQALSGRLFDAIGTKLGFAITVAAWSVCSMAHALARGLVSFDLLRFLLGLGEGGTWPGAAKAISEWFPVRERALAMGICNSGTAVGTLVATPLLIGMEQRFGWQLTFVAMGLFGVAWLLLWMLFYSAPDDKPGIGPAEPVLIESDHNRADSRFTAGWREILKRREAWAIIAARFFGDSVWWFYITWLPLYLFQVHHLSLQQIGEFAWMPFLAADAGSLIGGWASGNLIRVGWSVNRARKIVIAVAMILMLCGVPAAFASSTGVALALISVVLFGFQSWIGNVQTLCSDYFPQGAVATVMGLSGMGAGVGAMLLTQITGLVVAHFSYVPILITAGLLPIMATAALFSLGGTVRPIPAAEFLVPFSTAAPHK